jgi:hypothetical protein
MSSRSKLAIVAIVAFALGFAAARLKPVPQPSPAEDLAWERTGDTVRLTAKAPGGSYLIVQPGTTDPYPRGSAEATATVHLPAFIFPLREVVWCRPGAECNRCRYADDCPPPPLPPFHGRSMWKWDPRVLATR